VLLFGLAQARVLAQVFYWAKSSQEINLKGE
jgi:hypothetical protein